jgi:DNA-directed RNA polymerase specialized sigma24 family protein
VTDPGFQVFIALLHETIGAVEGHRVDLRRQSDFAVAPLLRALDQALQQLEVLDPALAQLVDLKFFCGFTFGELAAMRGVSERTVRRDWEKARLLLHQAIE